MKPIRNAWYVGALSHDVTTTPIQQTVLGEPVALYRTESGQAVALGDRCPHRFAPLHKGKVKGDCLECPYHGLQFKPSGACAFNPHGDGKIPQAAKVRHYPIVERDGIVWIWPGDPQQADESKVIDLSAFFGHGKQPMISGSYKLNAHFEIVLDNLLDLSHAPFLHPTTLADPGGIAHLRFEMKQEGNTVWAYHYVPASLPSAQFKPFRASTEPLCDTHAHMRWDPPCNLQLDVGVTECGRPDSEGLNIHIAHLLTPIDGNRTNYFWLASRDFVMDNEEISTLMQANVNLAFTTEDEPMIEAVAVNMGTSDLMSLKPVLLPGDAAGVRARRILKQLREQEQPPAVAPV